MIDDKNIILERNFDEVKIVDDDNNNIEKLTIIEEIIKNKKNINEDSFYILDVGELIKQHNIMISKMPRVQPYYAIKCCPDQTVIKTMSALKTGFDCASKHEIDLAIASGVSGKRIIFSHTWKLDSHLKAAKLAGVEMLTVDDEHELHKIKNIYPEAKIVIRFRCDASTSMVSFGAKFGSDDATVVPKLIKIAKNLGLKVYGFNFNAGTQCSESKVFARGIKIGIRLIEYARSLGFKNAKLINIGGGFPSRDFCSIDEIANEVNEALKDADPSIKVISEPGRYFVGTAFSLMTFVFGKKIVNEENISKYIYYVNDSVFGSFFNSVLNIKEQVPIPWNKSDKEKPHLSTILGSTLFAGDCIVRNCILPELNIGDWLLWPYNGAYSLSRWRQVMGDVPTVFPYVEKKIW